MSTTVIGLNDPKAVTRFSAMLATQVLSSSYFSRRFVGKGVNNPIQQIDDLESDAGDRVTYDLIAALRGRPTTGDKRLEGAEESLRFFTDDMRIDQARKAVSAGGKMSRKRTMHNLRTLSKELLSDYFAIWLDQLFFMYLSGARGVNQDFYEPLDYTGHAGNAFVSPDSAHIVYPGAVTSKASLTASDTMSRDLVEKVVTRASMLRATNPDLSNLIPVSMEGEERFVLVMSKYQELSMRTTTGATGWLEIQKAAAAAQGTKNNIFTGSLGMINNVILHSHQSVIRFSDYGAGSNIPASRALFMGRQAAVVAYGTPGGNRFSWEESQRDYGNEPTIATGLIVGVKKTVFAGTDFGLMSVDTSSPIPS